MTLRKNCKSLAQLCLDIVVPKLYEEEMNLELLCKYTY